MININVAMHPVIIHFAQQAQEADNILLRFQMSAQRRPGNALSDGFEEKLQEVRMQRKQELTNCIRQHFQEVLDGAKIHDN